MGSLKINLSQPSFDQRMKNFSFKLNQDIGGVCAYDYDKTRNEMWVSQVIGVGVLRNQGAYAVFLGYVKLDGEITDPYGYTYGSLDDQTEVIIEFKKKVLEAVTEPSSSKQVRQVPVGVEGSLTPPLSYYTSFDRIEDVKLQPTREELEWQARCMRIIALKSKRGDYLFNNSKLTGDLGFGHDISPGEYVELDSLISMSHQITLRGYLRETPVLNGKLPDHWILYLDPEDESNNQGVVTVTRPMLYFGQERVLVQRGKLLGNVIQ